MFMCVYMHTPERSEIEPDAADPVLNKPVVICGHT